MTSPALVPPGTLDCRFFRHVDLLGPDCPRWIVSREPQIFAAAVVHLIDFPATQGNMPAGQGAGEQVHAVDPVCWQRFN